MLVNIKASVPHKELGAVIEIIESVDGSVEILSSTAPAKKQKKTKKFLTPKIVKDVLEFKNKHPRVTNLQIAEKFDISATAVGNILRGETHLQQKRGQ